jgi:hypothetical protein
MRAAEGVGSHHAQFVRMYLAKSLTEALKTRQGSSCDLAIESTFLIETGTETHAFTQTVDDRELPVDISGDDHMEAVRPKIDRRQQLWRSTTVSPTHVTP